MWRLNSSLFLGLTTLMLPAAAQEVRVLPAGQVPQDVRLGELKNLNGYFPFSPVDSVNQWPARRDEIRRRILVSQGLWPLPTKTPLQAVVHGRVEREDYVVDRVFFESIPGHFVTGSLYRPKQASGNRPAILSPHGHWRDGRFYDAGEALIKNQIESGAEQFPISGRFPIQARAVQLARMGCIVFVYDMTGNADSIQIGHRPSQSSHLDRKTDWGFMSAQAELRLQNMMGLQTWNSIRAIDFLLELDDVDPQRIGVTGASGGGTQSMIIGAIDDRIAAAMPCVMVSTAMQGGCSCENAPYLRIDQGNVDIAAAMAPRPLGLTAADDWTVELETKGYPALVDLYERLGHRERLTAAFHVRFPHNYNQVNRLVMYDFFNRHFDLGIQTPIQESDFQPLSREEATVWTNDHPAPAGEQVGDAHEVRILRIAAADSQEKLTALWNQPAEFRSVVGGGWDTILARSIDEVGSVALKQTKVVKRDDSQILLGTLDHDSAGEKIPVAVLEHDFEAKGTVIWIADEGKSQAHQQQHVRKLWQAGYRVVLADLFGQGEFLKAGQTMEQQPMWYQRGGTDGWHRFAGYTFGYNHPLFVKRVHDILSLTKYAHQESLDVRLVGCGKVAGPLVIAAAHAAGDQIDHVYADLADFRFQELTLPSDPMFVPGAVKYLGIDGLIASTDRIRLDMCGMDPLPAAEKLGSSVVKHSSRIELLNQMLESLTK